MTSPDRTKALAWQAVEHNLAKVAAWLVVEHGWPANAPIASTVEERPPDELIMALAEFIWAHREHRDLYWYHSDDYDEFLAYMLEWDH